MTNTDDNLKILKDEKIIKKIIAESINIAKQNEFSGIVLDLEFEDPKIIEEFKVFAKRKSTTNPWVLYGIEIEGDQIDDVIRKIQSEMKSNKPFYAHFYDDEEMRVVFKNKVINVTPDKSTWTPIIEYGGTLNIPEEQLDFWPNRFQDEAHYFNKEDFIKKLGLGD